MALSKTGVNAFSAGMNGWDAARRDGTGAQ
jgi:hypothetical protein